MEDENNKTTTNVKKNQFKTQSEMAALRDGFEPFIDINLNALHRTKIYSSYRNALYNKD